MTRVIVLGPQEGDPTVGATVESLGVSGRTAVITAGWQEWEADDDALLAQLGERGVNLRLYARAETVWASDPDFAAAHRDLQDRLRQLRRVYNRQLAHLASNWMEVLAEDGPPHLLDPERAFALETIRSLDAHHLTRIREWRAEFDDRMQPRERLAVVRESEEIARTLDDCDVIVVEGGHVALLCNRLRLFGIEELVGDRTVVACSGGAMAVGPRVALFHDAPPGGPGHTEVALPGLGLYDGLVPFPHARSRLRLDDPARVARLAARFAPDRCVVLEPGTRLDWDGTTWTPVEVDELGTDGGVRRWEAA